MDSRTAKLWAQHNQHDGDRWRLFRAIAGAVEARTVLYPGSYVDVAPSFVFESVTYLDVDKRAARFFGDVDGVRELVAQHDGPADPEIAFVHADYSDTLDLADDHFDLLVSLYAGFISEHCTRHLRVGGTLLVNPSHGDAAMASIDPRYELNGVVLSCEGGYRVEHEALDTYLVPKKAQEVTADSLHASGRGVAYTSSPFAYLFTRCR